jgi:hypothetical protein
VRTKDSRTTALIAALAELDSSNRAAGQRKGKLFPLSPSIDQQPKSLAPFGDFSSGKGDEESGIGSGWRWKAGKRLKFFFGEAGNRKVGWEGSGLGWSGHSRVIFA